MENVKKKKTKKTIGVDFDGVIHKFDSYGDGSIVGEPMEDCKETLRKLVDQGYKIVIFTVRLNPVWMDYDKQYKEIVDWLTRNGFEEGIHYHEITNNKPEAMAYIDDRAIRFTNWVDMKRYFI